MSDSKPAVSRGEQRILKVIVISDYVRSPADMLPRFLSHSRDHSPLTDPLRLSIPSRYPDMCILLYR